ncbi:hypothetical protein AYL99_10986 [Fonsecaea erecta]|uniref:Uncharacterized protein n=1 Tax=Fonsecaea erecta TaxID=1367422 RepID=A0A178Z471_9EURO|nr:hypothetical protein AYL99_10986 [Fonsecaea erecta]OAP54538.1 hypothetical protein AYL99_10986 [Fonsecaea erecta]
MLFDLSTLAVLTFATGLSAAPYEHGFRAHNHVTRQAIQAFDIGTFTTNTDPTPQNLTIILQSANQGSQPLGGGVIQAVLSSADVIANQAGFT